MWSICKKELNQFFSSLTGYIAIIVFLLINGLVLFVLPQNNILDYGYATLDYFFSFAPWVLIFLVSAITMRSFADEYKGGTYELLRTRPLTGWQIVTGKFGGSLVVALLALVPTIVYYFAVNSLAATTGIDPGAATGSYLGLLLLTAVFTSVGVCVSSFTSNPVVSFILSLLACILLYFGFSALSGLPAFRNGSDYYIEMIGIDFHYQSISRGVIDTRDLVYFLTLLLFFLLVTRQNLQVRTGRARRKVIYWLALLLALVAVNVVASMVNARYDLTEEKRYSLGQPTRQVFAQLEQPVSVDVLVSGKELPAVVRKFQDAIEDFLRESREYSGNKIQYRFVNPYDNISDTAAERQLEDSLYTNYGLYPSLIDAPEKVGDKMEIVKLIHGAVIHYGDRSLGVDLLQGVKNLGTAEADRRALYNEVESKLEYKFASAIQKLSVKEKPTVAYALGHGEGWGYNVDDAVRTLLSDYRFDTINLRQTPYIPSEINALVILKPTQPFSDRDKIKIDQFVMNGGKVFWMVDNMYAEFDSLYQSQGFIAFDRGLNLEDLLFNYGVRINQNLLQDMQCDKLPQTTGESQQQRMVDWPFFPILDGTDHPISKNLDGVRAMFPTTIDTVESEGIRKTFLLRSSANSRVLPAPAKIDFEFLQIAPDANSFRLKNIPVGVLLEGRFRSLYRGRLPRAVADSLQAYGVPFRNEAAAEGKMILVADGDLATNQVSQFDGPLPMGMNFFTRYTYANKDFFLNSLDYLVNPANVLSTRSKEFTLRLLDPRKTGEERSKWQLINIALPLALVILFGVLFQQWRRYRFAS